jgi:hypothetical protein
MVERKTRCKYIHKRNSNQEVVRHTNIVAGAVFPTTKIAPPALANPHNSLYR